MCDSRSGSLRDEGQFSQGTVAQEGAAEGWEKQQTDYTRTSGLQPVRYRTKIAGWERANAGRATTVIPAPPTLHLLKVDAVPRTVESSLNVTTRS